MTSSVRLWISGARPRTLSAAIAPVAVGTAVAAGGTAVHWWRAPFALLVAVSIQVGVNYANDYSDGVRGTDDARRVGPLRLVGSGLVAPRQVKAAAVVCGAVAGCAGLVLAATAGWALLLVGAACLLAGWGYTGGPKPYGYMGLGEVFAFVFFGLVATAGTTYVLVERLDWYAVLCGVPVGLWAVAILVANNLRDIPSDTAAGKRTLAVRLGDRRTRWLYVAVLEAAFAVALVASIWGRLSALAVLGSPFAIRGARKVLRGASGPDLIPVLAATAQTQLISALTMALGLTLTS